MSVVKRYIEEPGTEEVLEICDRDEQLALCVICFPEIISTLSRLVREGKLQSADYHKLREIMFKEIEEV